MEEITAENMRKISGASKESVKDILFKIQEEAKYGNGNGYLHLWYCVSADIEKELNRRGFTVFRALNETTPTSYRLVTYIVW